MVFRSLKVASYNIHKGIGLARFFRRRATSVGQHLAAWLLSPVIVGAALLRPVIWRLRRRAA